MPRVRAALDLALWPVGLALAAPATALSAASGLLRVAVRGPEELRRVGELLERAAALLAVVDPPVRSAARQVDQQLVDDLVLAARAAPALVASASQAVGQFQLFVDYAQGARAAADQLLVDVAGLLERTDAAVAGTERVIALAEPVVGAADRTVSRADAVAAGAEGLLGRVDAVAERAGGTVDRADALVDGVERLVTRVGDVLQLAEALSAAAAELVTDVVELTGRARPAVEQAVDLADRAAPAVEQAVGLGAQLVDPARALVPVVRDQAPAVAGLLPQLVTVLGDLLTDLPELLRRVEQDVLPTLRQLRTTPGDVRALRDTVADIEPLVGDVEAELAGLPGSTLLRKRGRKQDGAQASEDDERS